MVNWTGGLGLLQGHQVEVQLLQDFLGVAFQSGANEQPMAQVGSDVPALQKHPCQGGDQSCRGIVQAMVELHLYQPAVS